MPRLHFASASITLAFAILAVASPAVAQDSDSDGAPDATDVYPCDASRVAVAYDPAQDTFGTLAFEDQWPFGFADRDFNDLNLAWNYEYRIAPNGDVESLRVTLHTLAIGADYQNGLGLHLPVDRSLVAAATLTVSGVTTALTPSTIDSELTVVLSDDLREHFGGAAGPINSEDLAAVLTSAPMVIDIRFTSPVALDRAEAPYDLYIFQTLAPGLEIHRPEYPGTAGMDQAYFGVEIDGSSANRKFVDTYGFPYALVFGSVVDYPKEGVAIETMYPNIVGFASSGGTADADFYTSAVVDSAAYAPAGGKPTPSVVPQPAIDTACVPTTLDSCRAILSAGLSQGDGSYEIDLDGPGGRTPFWVYCDMSTDGGGWTHIMHVRSRQTNTGAVNVSSLPNRNTQAKLSDADIRAIARAGQREAQMRKNSSIYIFRYTDARWASYSSVGWTNVPHDAKRSDGVWLGNRCNGHWNNRGFSSWDDSPYSTCDTTFAGSRVYMCQNHTSGSAPGAAFDVFVR